PATHIFLPCDAHAVDLALLQQARSRLDCARMLRMPGLIERATGAPGGAGEALELHDGCARWFFHQHMTSPCQGQMGRSVVCLRWRAARDSIQLGPARQQLLESLIGWNIRERVVAARRRDESEGRVGRDARNVLVARDLANPYDAHANGCH